MQKSKISNVEWGIAIGFMIMVSLAQWGLDATGVGAIVNEIIDPILDLAFGLYLYLRGVKLGNWEMLTDLILSLFLEEATANVLPWFVEGIVAMIIVKAQDSKLMEAVSSVAGKAVVVANIGARGATFLGKEEVSQNLKKFSSRADSLKQAADATQRNQMKIQGQEGQQFSSPYNTQNQIAERNALLASPRAAQLRTAQAAVDSNNAKKYSADNLRKPA